MISASPKAFFDSLEALEQGGVERIHVDVMDGGFVPRFGLYPEFVGEIRSLSNLPIDVHMMISNPEPYVEDFVAAGASRIVPHIEPVHHAHRLVQKILECGVEAGVALNPHTSLAELKYILSSLSVVTIMAINPGIVGHKIIPSVYDKVADLRRLFDLGNFEGSLEVDGGVTFSNVLDLGAAGADLLVVGAGTVFHPDRSVVENIQQLNLLQHD